MKKKIVSIFVIFSFIIMGLTCAVVSAKESPPRIGTGKVTALEEETIVVDVTMGKVVMTVGAVVSPDTKIMKKGKKITLHDIKVGDKVRIKWVVYENGHKAKAIWVK